MKRLYKHLIVAAVLVAGFAVAFGSYLLFSPDNRGSGGLDVQPAAQALPVRESSHRLSEPKTSELTIVEFLDFECEACGLRGPGLRTKCHPVDRKKMLWPSSSGGTVQPRVRCTP